MVIILTADSSEVQNYSYVLLLMFRSIFKKYTCIFNKCCTSTLPIGWNDPSDSKDLNQLLVDVAGRGTTKEVNVPQTIPLVTVNDDKLKKDLR